MIMQRQNRLYRLCGGALVSSWLCMHVAAAPMPIAPAGLTAGQSGDADVRLEWQSVGTDIYGDASAVTNYRIYGSTDPRFVPDFEAHTNLLAETAETAFTHAGAWTNAEDWFYAVAAVAEDGTESLVLREMACRLRRQIECPDGSNVFAWIGLPGGIAATNAEEVASLIPGADGLYLFDAETQTYEAWDSVAATGSNFRVAGGDVLGLRFSTNAAIVLAGIYSWPGQMEWEHQTNRFNHRWVAFPPESPVTNAAGVVAAIPESTKAARYDASLGLFQSWFMLGGTWMGTNFSLAPGEPVQVSIRSNSVWQMPSPYPEVSLALGKSVGFVDLDRMAATGTVSSPSSTIVEYAWDYDGDGEFDNIDSNPVMTIEHRLDTAASIRPTLRVRNAAGRYAVAHGNYSGIEIGLSFSNQAFRAGIGETGLITYVASQSGFFSVHIYDGLTNLVRTLESNVWHEAGTVTLPWDGLDEDENPVPPGPYHVVVEQTVGGTTLRYDSSVLAGQSGIAGTVVDFSAPSTFSLADGGAFPIQFTLQEPAYVNVTILDGDGVVMAVILSNDLRSAGTHYLSWDGRRTTGEVLAEGESFSVAVSSASVGPNALIVQPTTPVLSQMQAEPQKFIPSENPYGTATNAAVISYQLDIPADVSMEVRDATGALIKDGFEPGKTAGGNTAIWAGRDAAGRLVGQGHYSITIWPEEDGNVGLPSTTWVEVYY